MYSPNFTVEKKIFCLSLHYNGDDSHLFVNGKEDTKLKAKHFEIKAHSLCLGNISNEYPTSNDFKETALYGNVYDFSADYSAISNDKILDIHKYLMKKKTISYKMFGFVKKVFIAALSVLSATPLNVNSLECVSMKNQEWKTRSEIINGYTDEPVFYPFNIKVNKCGESCNNINDSYAKMCVLTLLRT